jgi:hypothetical protein
MPASDDDQVIVARFWPEDETAGRRRLRHWRAHIKYVNTGQQYYAPNVDEAFAVIRSLIHGGKDQN